MRRGITVRLLSTGLSLAMVLACMGGTFRCTDAKSRAVKLNAKTKRLKVGASFRLKVKKKKGIVIKKKKFYKKGAAVRVTKKGKIQARKPGKAVVYCKVKYRRNHQKKVYTVRLKCLVTVSGLMNQKNAAAAQTVRPAANAKVTPKPAKTTQTPEPQITEPMATQTPEPQTTEPVTTQTPEPQTTEPVATQTPEPQTTESVATQTPEPQTTEPVATQTPTAEEESDSEAAFEFVHKMGLGINLGNTMEAYCAGAVTTSQLETKWGQPITTQAMISGMKKAGFHTLRIPVSWSSMMSDDGKYTIDTALLQRVETIMNYALQEDMYVIINIHWDGQWWGQFGDADSSVREKAWDRYEAFWTQIASYYQDYSDHLIFESANEELGDRLNDNWEDTSGSQTGSLTVDECYQTVNAINQKFVDIVRTSGGNNATRFLLIAGYDTDIDKTCDSRYVMPTDTVSSRMMVSVHYYTPSTYCIVSDPSSSWGYDASWGTDSDIAAMQVQLAKMKIKFADQGVPVVIGEYGVADTYENGVYTRKEGRDVFIRTICEYALDHGMSPVLWDTSQIYSRSECAVANAAEAALYLELEEKAEEDAVYQPAGAPQEYVWSGTLQNSNYNQLVNATDTASNFAVTANGGCFTLSGVDWDSFEAPVIILSTDDEDLSGSCTCKFATSVDATNQYWPYIASSDVYTGTWNFGASLAIDVSKASLSGSQTVYFSLNGNDFTGSVTIRIQEKS